MVSGPGNYLGARVRTNHDENVDSMKLATQHFEQMCELAIALRLWLGFDQVSECTWFAESCDILMATFILGNLQQLAGEYEPVRCVFPRLKVLR